MDNKNTKKGVIVISDDLINRAIMAIESTEPTPEELEAEQLAKLIPSIRMAMDRGESEDKIRKKVKSIISTLHYTKIEALLEAASKIVSEHHVHADHADHADQNDHMAYDEVHHEPRV
jgi:hypothetical protein